MTRKIIIDTDPGQDDAVAILLAMASPELEVLALVVVAGNVPLQYTRINARKVLELAGRPDIAVYVGCDRPMRRKLVTAEHVHGKTGLDGPDLPAPTMAERSQHGVDYLIDTLRAEPAGSITLCPLGPLTNIAMALIKAPDIAARIGEIVLMGGAYFEVGNITPSAEFNIYVDPDAADVVLNSGVKITMIPLDVTHRALATDARLAAIAAIDNQASRAVSAMLNFSERFDRVKYGWDGAPVHDPNVIAYLLRPELYTGRQINVAVELASELTLGMTVVDYWQITQRPRNVFYVRDMDAQGFYDLLIERLARLP
ncbi:MAG: nucleoside hydrolase [Acetobacteraceae bacterium]|nr:nucleoside hydrolase [Acetobacteraceae bacterium]